MDTAMIVSCPTRLSYILTSREERNIAQRCATAMMILTTRFLFGAVQISGWRAGPIWSKSATTALVPPQFGQIFSVQSLTRADIDATLATGLRLGHHTR